MFKFRNLYIQKKLIAIIMLSSSIALLLASLGYMGYELVQFRHRIVHELTVLADIVGNNSTAALVFLDQNAAEEILSALKAKQRIVTACVYLSDGSIFAKYNREGDEDLQLPTPMPEVGVHFHAGYLHLVQPVYLEWELIGYVFIHYELNEIYNRLAQYLVITIFVLLLSAFVVFLVARRLQQEISGPLHHLTDVANAVSEKKDYSIRARKQTEDELGILMDRFNEMLAQIQQRDLALIKDQEELEARVQERTKALQQEILERERTEKEKEKIQAQLLHAQKMEAVGVLAGGIAHDFNNLLTGIQGSTEMVMLENEISDPVYSDLKQIQIAVERAADLTRQLLMFSRKQPMAFITLNFNKVIEELLKMLHRVIGEDIGIDTHFEPGLWSVLADRGTMEQVIMNLTVNARDAMVNGGTFTMTTRNMIVDKAMCETMPDAQPGKYVCLSVEDTGTGIDEETQKRIFEPFFTTKGVGKGTGLGLSVVYGIVQQHRGWIYLTSEPGRGSRFDIYLPAIQDAPGAEEPENVNIREYMGKGERILVIEDEKEVRKFVQRALEHYDYQAVSAATAREAVELFEKAETPFHLIFSDVVLPDGNGIDLVQNFYSRDPSLKILLSSGYTDHKSQWPIIIEKGFRYLQKPYVLLSLLKTVRTTLDSSDTFRK